MSEWATHSQELARKSLDRLNDELAKNSDAAWRIYVVADTLSEVTQGLIPQKDWEVIDLIRKEARSEAKKERQA